MIKSPDEYTVIVETNRGPKDFQYDQVFTPDHGQERVFEDTNVCAVLHIFKSFGQLFGVSCLPLRTGGFVEVMLIDVSLCFHCRILSSQLWMVTMYVSLHMDKQALAKHILLTESQSNTHCCR